MYIHYVSLSSSATYFRFFSYLISYATLYGLDSNVTKLLANLLTSDLYFIILPIVSCNLVSIKIIIIIIIDTIQ